MVTNTKLLQQMLVTLQAMAANIVLLQAEVLALKTAGTGAGTGIITDEHA